MSTATHNVLLIEDNPGDARLIEEMLAEDPAAPFALQLADRLSHGLERLSGGETGLVLLDLSLPDSHGPGDLRASVYAHSPTVPIIVLTGNDDQTLALSAVKSGAQDYLVKGAARPRAAAALDALLHRAQALPGAARAPGELRRAHRPAEPQPAARPPAPGGVLAARTARDRGGVHGPRPLQVRQRQPRPLDRRPAAEGDGRAPAHACCARATPWRAWAATSSC